MTAESNLIQQRRDEPVVPFYHVPTSPEDDLNSWERKRIQLFYSIWPAKRYSPYQYPSQLGTRVAIPLYNIGMRYSSDLCRTAIFVFMAYLQNNNSDQRTVEYLQKFYQKAGNHVNDHSLLERVYAWYVVGVYSLIGGESELMAIGHCRQFCKSLVALTSWKLEKDEFLWLELLWQRMVTSLYYVHRDNIVFDPTGKPVGWMESFEPLQCLLDESASVLPSHEDVSTLRLSMTTEWICQNLFSLALYMQFYWDRFLFQAAFTTNPRDLRLTLSQLSDILGRIINLIPQLSNIRDYICDAYPAVPFAPDGPANDFLSFPNVRARGLGVHLKEGDTALALLYVFARLLQIMLKEEEPFTVESHLSAIALCRLCASFPVDASSPLMVSMLVKRSLFWAGMVLPKASYPEGYIPWFRSNS